jgi:hypothetical protein
VEDLRSKRFFSHDIHPAGVHPIIKQVLLDIVEVDSKNAKVEINIKSRFENESGWDRAAVSLECSM